MRWTVPFLGCIALVAGRFGWRADEVAGGWIGGGCVIAGAALLVAGTIWAAS